MSDDEYDTYFERGEEVAKLLHEKMHEFVEGLDPGQVSAFYDGVYERFMQG